MPNVWHEYSQIARRERRAIFRRALIDSLPVLMGYVTMGFAAGVLMAVKGNAPFAPFWSGLCGAACISGTMSFAIVPAIANSASLVEVALLTLGINFRYAFYGFSLLKRWQGVPFFQKWLLVHTLSDEIYALDVACRIVNPLKNRYYSLWSHILNAGYWIVGTTAGAVAGSALPIPSRGIEFAMIALLLVILTDQMKGLVKNHA